MTPPGTSCVSTFAVCLVPFFFPAREAGVVSELETGIEPWVAEL